MRRPGQMPGAGCWRLLLAAPVQCPPRPSRICHAGTLRRRWRALGCVAARPCGGRWRCCRRLRCASEQRAPAPGRLAPEWHRRDRCQQRHAGACVSGAMRRPLARTPQLGHAPIEPPLQGFAPGARGPGRSPGPLRWARGEGRAELGLLPGRTAAGRRASRPTRRRRQCTPLRPVRESVPPRAIGWQSRARMFAPAILRGQSQRGRGRALQSRRRREQPAPTGTPRAETAGPAPLPKGHGRHPAEPGRPRQGGPAHAGPPQSSCEGAASVNGAGGAALAPLPTPPLLRARWPLCPRLRRWLVAQLRCLANPDGCGPLGGEGGATAAACAASAALWSRRPCCPRAALPAAGSGCAVGTRSLALARAAALGPAAPPARARSRACRRSVGAAFLRVALPSRANAVLAPRRFRPACPSRAFAHRAAVPSLDTAAGRGTARV